MSVLQNNPWNPVSLQICFLKVRVWDALPAQMGLKFRDHWPPVSPVLTGSAFQIERDLWGKV